MPYAPSPAVGAFRPPSRGRRSRPAVGCSLRPVRTVEPLAANPDPLWLPSSRSVPLIVAFATTARALIIALALVEEGCGSTPPTPRVELSTGPGSGCAGSRTRRFEPPIEAPTFESNLTREQFEANVTRIVEYIHAGDAYQVVPSQRFSAPCPVEAFSIYRGLRAVNPSPYMYFLDFGDFEIAGASPEPLVKVAGGRVETLRSPAPIRAVTARRRIAATPSGSSPIRRSEPSTSCSWTSAATTSAG